jgi:hypothetical protein
VSAEIRAWFEGYQQKLRLDAYREGYEEGYREGESSLLLRLLRVRFGELPDAVVARVEAADVAEIERWGERMLDARRLAEVFDEPS